jgi:hypothetical protein
MRKTLRFLLPTAAGTCLCLLLSGCSGSPNEESMAGTKGVAAANAPKTQAEFFKQQQEAAAANSKKGAAAKK